MAKQGVEFMTAERNVTIELNTTFFWRSCEFVVFYVQYRQVGGGRGCRGRQKHDMKVMLKLNMSVFVKELIKGFINMEHLHLVMEFDHEVF